MNRLISVGFLIAAVSGLAFLASHSTRGGGQADTTNPCVGCGELVAIPSGASPALVAQKMEESKARTQAKIQPQIDRLRKEAADRFKGWYGSVAVVSKTAPESEAELCKTFAGHFAKDLPAPEARKTEFAHYLADDSQVRCVRWSYSVLNAKQAGDGWEAIVRVRPHLRIKSGMPTYTPHTTLETWRLSRDGTMTPTKVEVDEPGFRGMTFRD
jgi:hypothetical protein